MKRGVACVVSLFVVVAFGAGPARAWNDHGHMLVAAIAWEQLDEAVQERVVALLHENPKWETWTHGIAAGRKGKIAFIRAATWPDDIKYADDYTDDGDGVHSADAARNIGYDDHLRHRYWHYTDLPFSPDGSDLADTPEPNAETQIVAFRDALASADTSAEIKSYDLVWLEHLVGDVHQPLHATSRFTVATPAPKGDAGGNAVTVCPAKRCGKKPPTLHAYWDNLMGTTASTSAIINQASEIAAVPQERGEVDDVQTWIEEGLEIAKRDVYVEPVGEGTGPYKLDAAYRDQAKDDARDRVGLAAARLAHLLNTALSE